MADVPMQQIAQVDPIITPAADLPANATPAAFGADVGQAMQRTGEVLTRIHQEHVQQANTTAALNGQNKLYDFENHYLYDPKTGVLNQRLGMQSPGAVEKTLADHQKLVDEITSGLTNDAQKAQFQRLASEHRTQVQRQLYGYETKELGRAQDETDQGAITNMINGLARAPNDEVGNWEKIARIRAVGETMAKRNGQDPKAMVDALTSDAHLTVLRSLADADQGTEAKAYYAENKGELDARALGQAHDLLKVVSVKDESRVIAAELSTAPNEEQALSDLEARDIKSTEVYDQAKGRIKMDYGDRRRAHNDTQQDKMEAIGALLEDPANTKYELPPTMLQGLDPAKLKKVLEVQKSLRSGIPTQTSDGVYLDLKEQLSNPMTWKEVVGDGKHKGTLDLEEYRGQLSSPDFKHFANEIEKTRQKVVKQDQTLSQGQIATDVSKRLFEANGLSKAKNNTPAAEAEAAMQGRFLGQLHLAVGAKAVDLQRNLNEDEITAEAKKLMIQTTWQRDPETTWEKLWSGDNRGILSDSNAQPNRIPVTGPAYQQPGAETFAYSYDQIPKDWQKRFDDSEKRTGRKRSEQERLAYYNANRPAQK